MIALLLAAALNNNLDDLIARVMTAYGGAAAWSKVTALHETGTVTPAMRPGDGKLTRDWQRPGKLRVEIVYPSSTEVRDVDGNHGTQNGKESTGMGLDAMRLQAARLALPQLLVDKRAALRQISDNVIEIPVDASLTVTVEIDRETGHIVRSSGKAAEVEFATNYGDFRSVDGLLFAFREENSAGEMKTGTNQLAKVEITRAK